MTEHMLRQHCRLSMCEHLLSLTNTEAKIQMTLLILRRGALSTHAQLLNLFGWFLSWVNFRWNFFVHRLWRLRLWACLRDDQSERAFLKTSFSCCPTTETGNTKPEIAGNSATFSDNCIRVTKSRRERTLYGGRQTFRTCNFWARNITFSSKLLSP